MYKFLFTCFSLLITTLCFSQTGRISGTIIDSKTAETLPGAMVVIEGTSKGSVADFDGKFAINNVSAGKVTLVVSYISYDSKKITDVNVVANDVTDIAIQLNPSTSKDLQEVEVVVTLNKENNTALVLQQKNNASVSDGVSAETIKRTPDRNTSDVLKRVSGVTIQDDKFVIVRGLNERYNASYLNGAPLPSTEPDKKAFAFDLFPANMLDNIVVNKTATPDMPSEFAGGIVQVNTKSIPEKNFVSFLAGSGYNTITTGKTKIISPSGKYDILGLDDGSRNLPIDVPAFKDKALWIANPDQARVATYFNNDWGYHTGKFAPNTTAQFATGYNFKLKERDFLGVIFSLSHNVTQNFYTLQRTEYDVLSVVGSNSATPQVDQNSMNSVYQTQSSTGALFNISCKINSNNSISLKNLATGSADNRFISTISTFTIGAPGLINRVNARYFTANHIGSSQLTGEHFLPQAKIKIVWNGALSAVQRTVPNLRFTSYSKLDKVQDTGDPTVPPNLKDTVYKADIGGATAGPNYAGYRVYSKLYETIKSSKIDISRLFKINEHFKIEGKIGGLAQLRDRQFNIRQFGMNPFTKFGLVSAVDSLSYLTENEIFSSQNMSVTPDGYGGFKVSEITKYDDNYHASSKLFAGYAMTEIKYTDKLRLIGGVRYESYSQKVIIAERFKDSVFVNSTVNDLLPSINLIYNINEKFGVRIAYYKTLNRAEFRELAVTNWYDPETRLSIAGNAALTRCYIKNYDLRFEMYPGRGQLFTVSGFYKYFNAPIEKYMLPTSENQIYFRNANYAHVYGAELEYRLNLGAILKKTDSTKIGRMLNNLNLFSNLSLIKSEVDVEGLNSNVASKRQMQGQAPYVINAGISYIDNKNGFSFTGMVNRVGDRLYIVGNDQIANRWENARTVVDLQGTKSFLKNKLEVRLNVKDLLHPDWVIYYKGNTRKANVFQPQNDYTNFRRNFGTVYSLVISYRF